jgi:hypothetical protein
MQLSLITPLRSFSLEFFVLVSKESIYIVAAYSIVITAIWFLLLCLKRQQIREYRTMDAAVSRLWSIIKGSANSPNSV